MQENLIPTYSLFTKPHDANFLFKLKISYHAKLLQQFLFHALQIQPMHDPQTKLDERQSSQGPEMLQQLQKQLQNNPICFLKQIEDTNGKGESIYMGLYLCQFCKNGFN